MAATVKSLISSQEPEAKSLVLAAIDVPLKKPPFFHFESFMIENAPLQK